MNVVSIPAIPGARKRRKRVGRGIGSGHGKTSTRGQKGQRARTGSGKRPGFEGGQNPLIRRLPKRGFRRKATGRTILREILNVGTLNQFPDGERITPERLQAAGIIHDARHEIKLLGDGELSKRLTIIVHQVSKGAKAKVLKTGGTVELFAQGSGFGAQGKSPQPSAQSPEPA